LQKLIPNIMMYVVIFKKKIYYLYYWSCNKPAYIL